MSDESAFYACPDRLRLPLIFYYGHTATVYINKLLLAGLVQVRFFLVVHVHYKLWENAAINYCRLGCILLLRNSACALLQPNENVITCVVQPAVDRCFKGKTEWLRLLCWCHLLRSVSRVLLCLQPNDRVDLSLETLLETGVDEMSWDDTVRAFCASCTATYMTYLAAPVACRTIIYRLAILGKLPHGWQIPMAEAVRRG